MQYIKDLKTELKTQKEIVTIFQKQQPQKESDSKILKLNEKLNEIFSETQQQKKENNVCCVCVILALQKQKINYKTTEASVRA